MFRGVTDLNVDFLRNWGFPRAVSHYAFRQIGVRTTDGVFTPSHIAPLFDSLWPPLNATASPWSPATCRISRYTHKSSTPGRCKPICQRIARQLLLAWGLLVPLFSIVIYQ